MKTTVTSPTASRCSFDQILLASVKALTVALLAYWGLYALLSPVTVWDSNTYNLARLPLTMLGGLFGNPNWNTMRQIAFPWSYDAVHLPFLWLKFGFSLPSFFCLLGTLWMIFRMTRQKYGEFFAWLAVLAVLSMPMVVYQSVSTKNDIPLVFLLVCIVYALHNFQQTRCRWWVTVAALCVGFLPGVKSSGIIFGFFAAIYVLWVLRSWRLIAWFAGITAASFLLLGSVEIYLHNWQTWHSPLGPREFVLAHSNHNGMAGAFANFIRLFFDLFRLPNGCYFWDKSYNCDFHFLARYNDALLMFCKDILSRLGLVNIGYMRTHNDATFHFCRRMSEAECNFGVTGAVFFALAAVRMFTLRWRQPSWWLVAAGWIFFGATCYTVGWCPWNNRFLMPTMLAFGIGVLLWCRPLLIRSRWPVCLLIAAAAGALLCSPDKNPRHLIRSVTDRQRERFKEHPAMLEVCEIASRLHREFPDTPWLLSVGGDSWLLPFFTDMDFPLTPAVDLNSRLSQLPDQQKVFILLLNKGWSPVDGATLIKYDFEEVSTAIYHFQRATDVSWSPPQLFKRKEENHQLLPKLFLLAKKNVPVRFDGKATGDYCASGWSGYEKGFGVWSDGEHSVLRFQVAGSVTAVSLRFNAFVNPAHPRQRIIAKINGVTMPAFEMTSWQNKGIDFAIPEKVQKDLAQGGMLIMEFALPDAISPKELGVSNDTRKLGILLKEVTLR